MNRTGKFNRVQIDAMFCEVRNHFQNGKLHSAFFSFDRLLRALRGQGLERPIRDVVRSPFGSDRWFTKLDKLYLAITKSS